MQSELSTWLPLWDVAAVLFVLGMASALSSRDRAAWWMSQGMLLLSVVIGFGAASATHANIDLFSLGIWVPIAWAVSLISVFRIPKAAEPHPQIPRSTARASISPNFDEKANVA